MNTGMSFRLFAAALALASFTCSPKPGGQTRGPIVIMIPGRLAPEGSFEDCVYQKMQGGMKLADALTSCAKLVPPDLAGTGIDAVDLMDRGTGVALSDCYGAWNSNKPAQEAGDIESKFNILKALKEHGESDAVIFQWLLRNEKDPDRIAQLQFAAKKAEAARQEVVEQYRALYYHLYPVETAVKEGYEVGDFPTPTDNGTAVARPNPESQSLCEQVSEFVGQCNLDGWNSPDCQAFLDKMHGCLDRKVADPADPAEPCAIPPIDPEKAREVMLLRCWAVRHPVPGEDPCTRTVAGEAFEYVIRTGANKGLNPCNNPYVRQTGEDCYPTFTLVRFREVDIRELIKEGHKNFGGPVFVIPIGPPGDEPNPNPKPEPTRPDQ